MPSIRRTTWFSALLMIVTAFVLGACSDDKSTGDGGAGATGDAAAGDGGTKPDSGASDGGGGDSGPPPAAGMTYNAAAADGCHYRINPSVQDQENFKTAGIQAKPGEGICLGEGTFKFNDEITLTATNLTIRGAGMDKTILDFSGQKTGANGIAATGNGFTIEGLKVFKPKGDGIRATAVKNVVFRKVMVEWPDKGAKTNGAYGLYPVESEGVLVEECVVVGASDAGIYVGQSKKILVRKNEVHGNVAGIEIENSLESEVVDNYAHDNTGGILVFNLPELKIKNGSRSKVHKNRVENNNLANFAPEGNVVANVPAGTGILVLAADENEITENIVKGNSSVGILLFTYVDLVFKKFNDPEFDIYPQGNYIHKNTLENNGNDPQGLANALPLPKPIPPLAWDGCVDAKKPDAPKNCFKDNGDAKFVNFDLCGEFKNQSNDISKVTCEGKTLPAQTGKAE
ncbi:MAG: hypothetical protein GMKNLPBB_00101 [Myxococcota bacterium]|nr:hypothetical protein [Myxococcota bacterium]